MNKWRIIYNVNTKEYQDVKKYFRMPLSLVDYKYSNVFLWAYDIAYRELTRTDGECDAALLETAFEMVHYENLLSAIIFARTLTNEKLAIPYKKYPFFQDFCKEYGIFMKKIR